MGSLEKRLEAVVDPLVINGNTYYPISRMPVVFPHFCETQCLAFNTYYRRCMASVLMHTHCQRAVADVQKRINDWSKINGPQWWKKKVAVKKDDTEVKEANGYE